jgi:hypothetical protein
MLNSAHYWRGTLRLTDVISAIVLTAGLLIWPLIITIIPSPHRSIDVVGGGG